MYGGGVQGRLVTSTPLLTGSFSPMLEELFLSLKFSNSAIYVLVLIILHQFFFRTGFCVIYRFILVQFQEYFLYYF